MGLFLLHGANEEALGLAIKEKRFLSAEIRKMTLNDVDDLKRYPKCTDINLRAKKKLERYVQAKIK